MFRNTAKASTEMLNTEGMWGILGFISASNDRLKNFPRGMNLAA